jgi:MFS family permease
MDHSTAQARPVGKRGGFRATLRNPYFLRLWMAQLISQIIQNATYYGSIVLLSNQSGESATAVGGVIIAFSIPAVLFGVPAGVLVDRWDKRTLLWASNAVRALLAFGFVATILLSATAFIPLYLLTFLSSVVGQFFGPAEGASIPLLVGDEELVPALSLFNMTFSVSQAIGLVIVGPLFLFFAPTLSFTIGHHTLTLMPIHELFIFIGIMYIVCALLSWTIPRERLQNAPLPPNTVRPDRTIGGVWKGVVQAATYVRRHKPLLIAVVQLTLGGTILTLVATISGAFADQFLHRKAEFAAIIFVPAGLGLVIGSMLMPRIIQRVGVVIASALGVIGVGASVVLLTMSRWLAMRLDPHGWFNWPPYLVAAIVLAFGIGASLDLITIPAQTTMQQQSPDWIKGRVLALQVMLLNAVTIPATLFIGVASDRLTLPVAMNLITVVVVLVGLGCAYLTERYTTQEQTSHAPAVGEPAPAHNHRDLTDGRRNPLPPTIVGNYEPAETAFPTAPVRPKHHNSERQTSELAQ